MKIWRNVAIERFLQNLIQIAGALLALVTVGFLIAQCDASFDFSDQGFYLNAIAHPDRFPVSVTQFGFIYHPLFLWLGEDVSLLRQANISLDYGLAIITSAATLDRLAVITEMRGPRTCFRLFILSSIIAIPALLSLLFLSEIWLPSPSYNSLVFQALLLTSTGFCIIGHRWAPLGGLGWIILAIGIFLALMAKPPSALVLSVLVAAALSIDGRINWRGVSVSAFITITLCIVFAYSTTASLLSFLSGLLVAYQNATMLNPVYSFGSLFRLDSFGLNKEGWITFAATTVMIAIFGSLGIGASRAEKASSLVAAITMIVFAALFLSDLLSPPIPSDVPIGLFFYSYLLISICRLALLFSAPCPELRSRLSLFLLFSGLPGAYAFGSGGNYWQSASAASFFILLASVVAFCKRGKAVSWREDVALLPISAVLISVVFLKHGLAQLYRDPYPLSASIVPTAIGAKGNMLKLNPDFAGYINEIKNRAYEAGFLANTPIIDLTGHYPGTLFALGAKPLGAPWLIGGYLGSTALAQANLDHESCADLVRAWILVEPEGPRRLPSSLLARYGIDVAAGYSTVAILPSPKGSYPQSYRHELVKPDRPLNTAACQRMRQLR